MSWDISMGARGRTVWWLVPQRARSLTFKGRPGGRAARGWGGACRRRVLRGRAAPRALRRILWLNKLLVRYIKIPPGGLLLKIGGKQAKNRKQETHGHENRRTLALHRSRVRMRRQCYHGRPRARRKSALRLRRDHEENVFTTHIDVSGIFEHCATRFRAARFRGGVTHERPTRYGHR